MAKKANDVNVPEDELNLARLLQNAKAHGLGWTRGCHYRNGKGQPTQPVFAVACCAEGASALTTYNDIARVSTTANDDTTGKHDNPHYRLAVELGHAFRSAMCDGEPWDD